MTYSCTRIHTVALICLVTLTSACQERGVGAGGGMWGSSQPQPNAALQSLVDGTSLDAVVAGPQMPAAERTRLVDQVRRVYKDLNYQLIWIDGDRPSSRYGQFVKVLDAADDSRLAGGAVQSAYRRSVGQREDFRRTGAGARRQNHGGVSPVLRASDGRASRSARAAVAVDVEA